MSGSAEQDASLNWKFFYAAIRMMFSGMEVVPGISKYCQYLQTHIPNSIWDRIKELDWDADLKHLSNWLSSILNDEPPPQHVELCYFGLSDLGDHMNLIGYRGYTQGKYGLKPIGAEYTWPHDGDSQSEVLQMIHQIVYNHEDEHVSWIGEACLPIAYAGLGVAQIFQSLAPSLLLSGRDECHIAVCFDEGDFFILGKVKSDGWEYHQIPSWVGE